MTRPLDATDAAIEVLGDLVSMAGGRGDAELDVLKDALSDLDMFRGALEQIGAFDASQGSPIAPRENPTTTAMRRIAHTVLERSTCF